MTGTPIIHEIYGVKFGQNLDGRRGHFFSGPDGDPHDQPMQLDYFVWAIRSSAQDVIVDAGFTTETNRRRRRDHWEDPHLALARIGVDAATVPLVIISHLHYDHCGDLDGFPAATFVLQEEELAFWTSAYASRGEFARHIEPADLRRVERLHGEGRVLLVDGAREVADGIWVQRVGGHTPGMQVVLVRTQHGVVVLASDASHFFENIEHDRPFAVHADVVEMYRAFDTMNELATSGIVVAGHDPALFDRFPAVDGLDGRALKIA